MIDNIQTGYTVFDEKANAQDKQKVAFKANVRYLHEALAQVCSLSLGIFCCKRPTVPYAAAPMWPPERPHVGSGAAFASILAHALLTVRLYDMHLCVEPCAAADLSMGWRTVQVRMCCTVSCCPDRLGASPGGNHKVKHDRGCW